MKTNGNLLINNVYITYCKINTISLCLKQLPSQASLQTNKTLQSFYGQSHHWMTIQNQVLTPLPLAVEYQCPIINLEGKVIPTTMCLAREGR